MGQENVLSHFFMYSKERKRGEADFSASPLKFPVKLLVEVPLQQALKGLAVAGFVTGHFMRQAASVLPLEGTGKRKTPTKASISERK